MTDARPARGVSFWFATWFGSGLLPKAPGTWGTVASLALWGPMVLWPTPWWARLGLALALFAVGIPAASKTAIDLDNEDPKEVVIDEVAGMGVAIAICGPSYFSLLLGFLLFRLFDIRKPFPVGWADRNLHGGLGIMVDDMFAGAWALGLLWLIERFASPWLVQWWGGPLP